MSISEDRWFEIWYVDGDLAPCYLLIATSDPKRPGRVLVLDPPDRFKVVHQSENYDETQMWLREDEFSMVDGRVFPDDGWPES